MESSSFTKKTNKSSRKGCEETGADPAGGSSNQEGSLKKGKTTGDNCQVVITREDMPPPRELARRTRASGRMTPTREDDATRRPGLNNKPGPRCSKVPDEDPQPGPSSQREVPSGTDQGRERKRDVAGTIEIGGFSDSDEEFPDLTVSDSGVKYGCKARALFENTRKRGRPPSTGEWIGAGLARLEKIRLDAEETDGRLARMSANLLSSANVILARDEEDGVAGIPTRDLLSATKDSLEAINNLRKLAKGLNGRHKGTIKTGVGHLEIAIGELATRVDEAAMRRDGGRPSESTLERALEVERERTRRAEEKIAALNAELARLRKAALPDEPPPPLRGKRRGIIDDSSSSSEGRSLQTRRVVKRKRKGRGLTPEIEDEEEMMSLVRPVSPSPPSVEPLPQGKDRERAFPPLVAMDEQPAEEAPPSPVQTHTYAGVMGGGIETGRKREEEKGLPGRVTKTSSPGSEPS